MQLGILLNSIFVNSLTEFIGLVPCCCYLRAIRNLSSNEISRESLLNSVEARTALGAQLEIEDYNCIDIRRWYRYDNDYGDVLPTFYPLYFSPCTTKKPNQLTGLPISWCHAARCYLQKTSFAYIYLQHQSLGSQK